MDKDTHNSHNLAKVAEDRLKRAREYSEKGLVLVNAFTGHIANHNYDGMCIEEGCGERYTKYTKVKINGIKLLISLCDEHASKFEEFEV